MSIYKIPDVIRVHNRVLNHIAPFPVEGEAEKVLREYESIIQIQRMKLEEEHDQQMRKRTSTKERTLVGESYDIRRIRQLCDRMERSDASVIITAETGCGKELVAQEIQRRSKRWDKPFIKVNCSAFPETLFESELFGYEAGAFTGALKGGKKGLLEAADTGTIFFDEIGELPMSMQAKLLRALQEREIIRVGGTQAIPIDVRIIAATNRPLRDMVNEHTFRADLFFRLNVMPITISPLRERKEDIELLATHFLEKYSRIYNTPKSLTPSAVEALMAYPWPGNVRELENIMERLVAWGSSEHLERVDIESVMVFESDNPLDWYDPELTPLEEKLAAVERHEIMVALRLEGTTRKAAKRLGITQPTLVRRMKEYQIYMDPTTY